jgi:hypothetical protein
MLLFPLTALYNSVVTETNLPLLLLRSTKCDDENREAHAASPPKGMRNKREREREREKKKQRQIHTPTAQRSKPQKLADRRTQEKKNYKREKTKFSDGLQMLSKSRSEIPPASSRKKSKLTQQPRNAAATTKERSSSDVGKKKHEESETRALARQRENIMGRAAAASEWTVAMDYGPRAKSL